MKKHILSLLFLMHFIDLLGQNTIFKGTILVNDSFGVRGGLVIFPLIKDTITIDKTGIIKFDLSDPSKRVFYFTWTGWKSKIFRFDHQYVDSGLIDVKLPDIAYYDEFQNKKLCPLCRLSDEIIPVIYGLPSKKMMRDAKRGKYQLGGCVIMENNSKFFCKKDNFEF